MNIKNKKFFWIGLIVILLLGLSVVSAQDNTTTTKNVKAKDVVKNPINTVSSKTITKNKASDVTKTVTNKNEKITNNLTKKEKKNVKKASQTTVNNYQELYDTLSNNPESDITVSLSGENTYIANETINQIQITENTKKLVINGNGRTIDINNTYGFINSEYYSNITINDLIITHSYYNSIEKTKGNLILNNVTFKENIGNGFGNALYVSDANCSINTCSFESNGANISEGDVYGTGGAVFAVYSNLTIDRSKFDSNMAKNGGAIYFNNENGTLNIFNSEYTSNGIIFKGRWDYYTENGGAIYVNAKNTTIRNSTFRRNDAYNGAALYHISPEFSELTIYNSTFEENGNNLSYYYSTYQGGAIFTSVTATNVNINKCNFISNNAYEGAAITYVGNKNGENNSYLNINNSIFKENGYLNDDDHTDEGGAIYSYFAGNVTITNCDFDSNKGTYGGAIYANGMNDNDNMTITNTNFSNHMLNVTNTYMEYCINGGVIHSYDTNLLLNYTNFDNNGVNFQINNIDYLEFECYGGALYYYGDDPYYLKVDNSNFTSNMGLYYGGAICSYGNSTINHTTFLNNLAYNLESGGGSAIYTEGRENWIDNSYFISNVVIEASEYSEETFGVIAPTNYNGINVTNCVFINNTPESFLINNSIIHVRLIEEYPFYEYYIPNFANVTIYIDESNEGTNYTLTTGKNDEGYDTTYVVGFEASEDSYLIKMVVTQTEESRYYEIEEFVNNVYYFIMPHEFILTVNASDVKYKNSSEIEGNFYYTKSDGSKVFLADKEVELYINGTFIEKTTTDSNGKYSFKYPAYVLGNQDVLVKFTGTFYLTPISNSTSFNVEALKTSLQVSANNSVKVGETVTITGKLVDETNNPVTNTKISLYIDDDLVTVSTNNKGSFNYKYKTKISGQNYVLAMYNGDYGYVNSSSKTTFKTLKLDSYISIAATNTTENNPTKISGILKDINNKAIGNAQVIIYSNGNQIANLTTDKDGKYSYTYTLKGTGKYTITSTFYGDDNHNPITKNTKITVTSQKTQINTKITVKSVTAKNGDKVTLEATVKDVNGKAIKEGKVLFKVNKKTITDSKGKSKFVSVKNGKATLTYTPPAGLYNKKSVLSATYTGTSNYNSSTTNNGKLNLIKRNVKIIFDKKSIETLVFDSFNLKAKVKDENGKFIKSGNVTFKINSKTIKVVSIKNGIATFKYKLTNQTGKTYTISAVFSSNKYNRTQKTIKLNVSKIPTQIKANNIKTSSNTFTLKAKVLNYKNKLVKTTSKVTVKINGHTYINKVKVSNGKINLKIPSKLKKGNYKVNILFGANSYYNSTRKDINLTITK